MALAQAAFRFGLNSGTESTHGWHAAQNVSISLAPGTTFLLRFLVQASGGVAHSNLDFQFQYNRNGTGWSNITSSSAVARATTTAAFINGADTTNRLTGGTGTFESSSQGCTTDGTSGGNQFDIVASGFGETECSLTIVAADVANGDTIQFRLQVNFAVSKLLSADSDANCLGSGHRVWCWNGAGAGRCGHRRARRCRHNRRDSCCLARAPLPATTVLMTPLRSMRSGFMILVSMSTTYPVGICRRHACGSGWRCDWRAGCCRYRRRHAGDPGWCCGGRTGLGRFCSGDAQRADRRRQRRSWCPWSGVRNDRHSVERCHWRTWRRWHGRRSNQSAHGRCHRRAWRARAGGWLGQSIDGVMRLRSMTRQQR